MNNSFSQKWKDNCVVNTWFLEADWDENTWSKETLDILQNKKYNFVIIWFWDLWKWWHQLLTDAGQNVIVCSLNWRAYTDEYSLKHNIHAYNVFHLPIEYDAIDVVLVCCTASDIWLLHTCLPKKLIEEKSNKLVFFQNGIGIRQRIKQLLLNTPHPTQAIPYFSFKTNWGSQVDIALAKPSPITGDQDLIYKLTHALNVWPHQNHRFEWMDSIVLRKEERKKWYVNAFLNSICVIYKLPVGKAVKAFIDEFGQNAKKVVYKELLIFNNHIAKDELANMEIEEIEEDIENAIEKFFTKYPSTYNQYYATNRNKVHSDEHHFIWMILSQSEEKWIELPILKNLYMRMQEIKRQINSSTLP